MTSETKPEEAIEGGSDGPTNGEGTTRRCWCIHPGDHAQYWQSFKQLSHIGMSWGIKHDLRELNLSSQLDLREWLAKTQQLTTQRAAARASQLWSFLSEMQCGDLVCAAGQSQLLGWGEVVGEYEYVLDGQWPEHRRNVQWKSLDSKSAEHFSNEVRNRLTHPKSLVSLTKEQFMEIESLGEKRAWLFQANPKYYDIKTNLAITKMGDSERWVVQSYWK